MRLINFRNPILSALMSVMILTACNIEELPDFGNTYLPDYNGEIALLLVSDTLSIREFLEETITDSSTYEITNEERIIVSYAIESDFDIGSDFVDIQDFSNSKYLPSPIKTAFVAPIDTVLSITKRVSFDFPAANGEQLDSIYYLGGNFELEFNSGFPSQVDYTFSTESFVSLSTGQSITISSSVDPNGAPPAVEVSTVLLEGYKTNLISQSDSNQFYIDINTDIFLSAGEVLTGNEYVNIKLSIRNPQLDVVFGSFGQDTFNVQETSVDLSFMTDLGGDGIVFESPQIEFNIENGFGLPVSLDFSNVYASYEGKEPLTFMGTFPETPQLIDASPVGEYGTTKLTTLTIDENNSNLRDLLSGSPSQLSLPIIGYSNYEELQANWLDDSSRMDIRAKVSIPLSFRVDGFEYDEIFELQDLSDLENTEELTLLFNTVNELPFDGTLDLYFLDENEVPMDSIVENVLFATPTSFDSNGKVLEPSDSRTEIVLNESLIDALVQASNMRIVVGLNSYNASQGDFVEIFADYEMKLKVGIAGKLSYNLNGN